MKLKDLCAINNGELEVIDRDVDISHPYYNYGGLTFDDDMNEHYLILMEKWFQDLDVISINESICTINCFEVIKKQWSFIIKRMDNSGKYSYFISSYGGYEYIINDDEAIADYVEDIFICLSQGFYSFARDFCYFLDLCKGEIR